jgi:amino acid transporter
MGALTGLLLVIGSIGGTNSWVAGAARVPFAAGVDTVLPSAFGRLHERYRTPHVALIVQGLAASALFLASVFVSLGGGQTTVQESYDILVNLTILIYFVPYLYLFAAWIRLRQREAWTPGADSFTVPGGNAGALAIAACGFLATLIAIGLVFVPPPDTENILNYEANLAGQSLLLFVIGFAFYAAARRRPRAR